MTSDCELTKAVEDALNAPSVRNTQPWKWRIRPDEVELHADEDRYLDITDPDRRDLVLSCGAALHHLQAALAARGRGVRVRRLPDPENRNHLATVTVEDDAQPDLIAASLYPAITSRHTDRRRMSHRPVPRELLQSLQKHARRAGAELVLTDPGVREKLMMALSEATELQYQEPGYAAELRIWTHRLPGSHDGVPATSVPPRPIGATKATGLSHFGRPALAQPPLPPGRSPDDDAADFLVLATPGDDVLDQLKAGEAASAVLLEATRIGLATTPLSQALEIAASRHHLQTDVLGIPEHPQLVIRVGWPAAGSADLPMTPRRPLRSVVLPS
ncbi:Acg family FMN-binding oxidoreductase [Pseudonocardia sp. CA-142604]|uniref:Acg family FMN-binding oxidoreductase n=1 Tax=Pseudonocardia sp. CA-142604 TaxID=3240024 RepID=UPI003D8C2636